MHIRFVVSLDIYFAPTIQPTFNSVLFVVQMKTIIKKIWQIFWDMGRTIFDGSIEIVARHTAFGASY